MLQKDFNKWYNKVKNGVEGYEGISSEKGKLLHSSEFHVADLEVVGMKLWNKGQLVKQELWEVNEEGDNADQLRILIKRCAELLVTTDLGKTIWYFGDNSKCCDSASSVDEILIYLQGKSGSYLVHGNSGEKVRYLANIGAGDAFGMMKSIFDGLTSREDVRNEDTRIILE